MCEKALVCRLVWRAASTHRCHGLKHKRIDDVYYSAWRRWQMVRRLGQEIEYGMDGQSTILPAFELVGSAAGTCSHHSCAPSLVHKVTIIPFDITMSETLATNRDRLELRVQ